MIEIQQEASTHPKITHAMIKHAIEKTLAFLDNPEMDITIRLTSDGELRQMNQTFRGIANTTDVLAFNQDTIDPETGRLYLGDIIISVERALQQAPDNDHSLDEECAFLAIHGTLHLLGFDHYELEEKQEMWGLQDKIYMSTINSYREKSE